MTVINRLLAYLTLQKVHLSPPFFISLTPKPLAVSQRRLKDLIIFFFLYFKYFLCLLTMKSYSKKCFKKEQLEECLKINGVIKIRLNMLHQLVV